MPPHDRRPGAEQPIAVLESDATGDWQVTTGMGTRYMLHLPKCGDASVMRLSSGAGGNQTPHDRHRLRLFSWQSHRAARGADPALLLGDRLVLVMEPLSPGAEYSVHITSPVTAIQELDSHDERMRP